MTVAADGFGATYRDAACLVTGGAGFVGSHLAGALLGAGARVRVIDDLSTGHARNVPDGVDLREASILDARALEAGVEGCDVVFHQAAMVSVPLSVERPDECAEVNVDGTRRLLEASRAAGVRRVVFASSSAVYGGDPQLPSREGDPIDCRSPYAASKAAGEALVSAWGRCYELSTVSLRYFNVYGPRQDPKSPYAAAIAAFLDALRAGTTVTIFGDGKQTRDFVFVEDVVRANLAAGACAADLQGEALNVGTARRAHLLEIVSLLASALGVEPEVEFEEERAGDVRHSVADVARAREVLGYEATVELAAGLGRLVAHEQA